MSDASVLNEPLQEPVVRAPMPTTSQTSHAAAVALISKIMLALLAVVALAATGMLFTAASFWICLGCASIGYQMASRVVRSIPRSKGSVKVPTATSTHVEHPEPAQS